MAHTRRRGGHRRHGQRRPVPDFLDAPSECDLPWVEIRTGRKCDTTTSRTQDISNAAGCKDAARAAGDRYMWYANTSPDNKRCFHADECDSPVRVTGNNADRWRIFEDPCQCVRYPPRPRRRPHPSPSLPRRRASYRGGRLRRGGSATRRQHGRRTLGGTRSARTPRKQLVRSTTGSPASAQRTSGASTPANATRRCA